MELIQGQNPKKMRERERESIDHAFNSTLVARMKGVLYKLDRKHSVVQWGTNQTVVFEIAAREL
jgi:hypothetical protein